VQTVECRQKPQQQEYDDPDAQDELRHEAEQVGVQRALNCVDSTRLKEHAALQELVRLAAALGAARLALP
jgi:hypothetical protein